MSAAHDAAHAGESELARGLAALGIDLPERARAGLGAYVALLAKWNRVYNLTGVRDESTMLSRHVIDSLTVLPHLGASLSSLADVGSGAGLPGIPLALARPELSVALVESSQKKASFLTQAKIELALGNVAVHCARVEGFAPPKLFDAVISRAYASLGQFVASVAHLLAPGGRLLAMKGRYPDAEAAALPQGWRLAQRIPLAVPGVAAQRHLIVITRA